MNGMPPTGPYAGSPPPGGYAGPPPGMAPGMPPTAPAAGFSPPPQFPHPGVDSQGAAMGHPPPGALSPSGNAPLGGANAVSMGSSGAPHDLGWAGRQQMQTQKATTLFVGSIPNGVTDRWMKLIFEVSRGSRSTLW
jgi:hypothetical protein